MTGIYRSTNPHLHNPRMPRPWVLSQMIPTRPSTNAQLSPTYLFQGPVASLTLVLFTFVAWRLRPLLTPQPYHSPLRRLCITQAASAFTDSKDQLSTHTKSEPDIDDHNTRNLLHPFRVSTLKRYPESPPALRWLASISLHNISLCRIRTSAYGHVLVQNIIQTRFPHQWH